MKENAKYLRGKKNQAITYKIQIPESIDIKLTPNNLNAVIRTWHDSNSSLISYNS